MPQCYDDAGKLICGYGTAVHVHEDKCYDEEKNLICGYETAARDPLPSAVGASALP